MFTFVNIIAMWHIFKAQNYFGGTFVNYFRQFDHFINRSMPLVCTTGLNGVTRKLIANDSLGDLTP